MLINYWSQVEGAVSLCKTSPKFSKFFTRNPCQFSLSLAIFLCQFGFSLPLWCFIFGGDFAWSSSRRSFCKYIITATEHRQLSKYSWKIERLAYSFRGLGLIIRRGFTCGIGLLLARLLLAQRVFLWVVQFPSFHKNQHPYLQCRQGKTVHEVPH